MPDNLRLAGVEGRAKLGRSTELAVRFNPDLVPIAPDAIPSPGRTVSTKARFCGPAFARIEPARTVMVRPFPEARASMLEEGPEKFLLNHHPFGFAAADKGLPRCSSPFVSWDSNQGRISR